MIKLNLGCGHKLKEGYINVDSDIGVNPDYVLNLGKDILPFEDNTFDEVLASHILEHIGEGYLFLMKELYRVCKNNATIEVFAPHHRSDWFHDDPTHVRPITINSFKLFSKKYINDHINVYGSSNGIAIKENIDFQTIDARMRFSSKWDNVFKSMPDQQVFDIIEERNNVVEEIYVKLLVIKD